MFRNGTISRFLRLRGRRRRVVALYIASSKLISCGPDALFQVFECADIQFDATIRDCLQRRYAI